METNLDLLLIDDSEDPGSRVAAVIDAVNSVLSAAHMGVMDGIPPRLAIPMLAAYARNEGHSVDAIYNPLNVFNRRRFRQFLREKPRVVGITTVALFHAPLVEAITKEIRAISPESTIVLGGHGAQDYADIRALADLTVSLHGEVHLARLLTELRAGRNLDEIEGVRRGPDGARMLDGAVRYEGVDHNLYPDWSVTGRVFGRYPIEASRGCKFNCIYCDFPGRASQSFRKPEDVFGEMCHIIERYGVRRFDFVDSTFASEPDFILPLCDLIDRSGLELDWHCFTRPDAYARRPELAERMAAAGCTWIFMGIESIHDPILARMRRGMRREAIEQGLARAFEAGIAVHGNFIVGFPGETPETVRETADFIRRHPFNDVMVCTLGVTPDILESAARDPARYGHLTGIPTKRWRHDTMDYPTALNWTRWVVKEANRGRLVSRVSYPKTCELDALPL